MNPLTLVVAALTLTSGSNPGSAQEHTSSSAAYDVVIANARIVDGTGNPWYGGDIGIRGRRIATIGDLSRARGQAPHRRRGQGRLARLHRYAQPRLVETTRRPARGEQDHPGRDAGDRGRGQLDRADEQGLHRGPASQLRALRHHTGLAVARRLLPQAREEPLERQLRHPSRHVHRARARDRPRRPPGDARRARPDAPDRPGGDGGRGARNLLGSHVLPRTASIGPRS